MFCSLLYQYIKAEDYTRYKVENNFKEIKYQ